MQEVKLKSGEHEFTATYEVFDDTLVVLLPDGSQRETELQGLRPEQAALVHLKSYARTARHA